MRLKQLICLALGLVTFGLYWPTGHFAFLYYDDQYFLQNPFVTGGLSLSGVYWALTSVVAENWHPVTTFSFLLTHQIWGFNPGLEHLLDAAIHSANAALLFLFLLEVTGNHGAAGPENPVRDPSRRLLREERSVWPSAVAAAIFAWHPLRVESVAWIAERKDVLFMFFMLLSMLFYARYTQSTLRASLPPPNERTIFDIQPRKLRFSLALAFFVMSLLCKAMSVTLPFILLLLDLWPLRRLNVPWRTSPLPSPAGGAGLSAELSKRPSAMGGGEGAPIQRLVAEKLPFFIVSAVFCVITFRIQSAHDALASFHQVGIGLRMENVICSYAGYLGKIFWPTGLAIIYPFPGSFDPVQVWLCALLLLAISALCLLQLPRRPYLAVGWFWFLGTLVPVVGLVQLGLQGMADRYTYLPMIGLVIALVWLVSDWVRTNSILKWTAGAATAAILLVCLVLTSRELPDWRDNIALFTHTIAVTRNNSLAEFPLAKGFEHKGLLRQAAVHYRIAIARGPDDENFWPNFYLAILFNKGGHYKEAKACLETAVKIKPNQPDSLNNLAWLLCTCPDKTVRDGETAVKLAEKACELTHDGSARYLTTLAAAYADVGQFDDAVATIQKAGGLAQETGQTQLFNADADLLQLFTNHQTYTDTSK